jgi:hypothetical protein
MRVQPALCLLGVALTTAPARAESLYETSVIVTGMDLRSRPAGLVHALGQVLAKVSGNPAWLADPRVARDDPTDMLLAIAYVDRETNLPKHDEQGTRDRPYDLHATFAASAIDARLLAWGDKPWTGRPSALIVVVNVAPRNGEPLTLHADTDADERHRGALLSVASQFGVTVWLAALLAPVPPPVGSPELRGSLVWSDADFGWVSTWTLVQANRQVGPAWGLRGVGFDAAYRDGVAGAVQRLSGH